MASRTSGFTRRTFLKAGATAAAAAGLGAPSRAEEAAAPTPEPVPARTLGRTGEKVSMINLGTGGGASFKLLMHSYQEGVRYIDTADCYAGGKSEQVVADYFEKTGRRKDYFLVTKDHPNTPKEWLAMVDRRLEALRIDTIDLFFLHGLGGGGQPVEAHRNVPKEKEWAQAAETMKKSGKVKHVGFSTHCKMPLRIALLENAAAGGWVDAIMVANDPLLSVKNDRFNKALDKCHQADIGLINMKEMRGVAAAPKFLPQFEEMGLTSHQAVLHAIWSDERFASICSNMNNTKIVKENTSAARNFKPLSQEKISAVRDLYQGYATTCNGCDGQCATAAGTRTAFSDIARYLSYDELDGQTAEARRLFAGLNSEERDWAGADLAAASRACVSRLDLRLHPGPGLPQAGLSRARSRGGLTSSSREEPSVRARIVHRRKRGKPQGCRGGLYARRRSPHKERCGGLLSVRRQGR